MSKLFATILFGAVVFAVTSCRLINPLTNDPNLKKAPDLWPDVPRMEGLVSSEAEMPMFMKILMRTALNNLWRLNNQNEDRTPSRGDWLVYTTPKTPDDVKNFYNNQRMTSFGNWEASKNSTCSNGNEHGFSGVGCVFRKSANNLGIGLLIVATPDEQKKQTNVFFIRVETDEKQNSNKPTNANAKGTVNR